MYHSILHFIFRPAGHSDIFENCTSKDNSSSVHLSWRNYSMCCPFTYFDLFIGAQSGATIYLLFQDDKLFVVFSLILSVLVCDGPDILGFGL